ncbi:MAG: Bax inhibitor-1/YccA family protein [Tepidisphaeraceae bacterium]
MSNMPNPFGAPTGPRTLDYGAERAGSTVLVSFFNQVYAWMATGLALTALVAWWVANNYKAFPAVFNPGVLIGIFVVEIILVVTIAGAVNKVNATFATVLFLLYAALNGVTLAGLFMIYTQASLAGTFLATAGTFGAMSVYGMVTRRDLTSLGSILFMALIGLIIASVVNLFWANSMLYWIITYAGILIFVGLTAYDTQKLKYIALATADNARMASRMAISGALSLYLDFVNLFLLLLRLMGDRR